MHKFNLILAMKLYDGKPLSKQAIDERLKIWTDNSATASGIRNIISPTAENSRANNFSQNCQL